MSDELIDRVATVLEEHFWRDDHGGTEAGQRLYIRTAAEIAVRAMRVPTEEMLSAGDSMMPQITKGQDIATGYDALKEAWPVMIDAALSPVSLRDYGSAVNDPGVARNGLE